MASTMGTKRMVLLLLCAAAAVALALAVLVAAASKPAGAVTDKLPDLGMRRLTNIQIQTTTDGKRLLRFDTVIANVGAGKFELHGTRTSTSDPTLAVHQHIFNDAGGFRDRPTGAVMFYSGDGHNHWHIKNLERYTLTPLDNDRRTRTGAKMGFCFFDNTRFGATTDPFYRGCASGRPDALRVIMGLSKGWADTYEWTVVGQYINVTNLPKGRYRLRATADRFNWFKERKETNNFTWADVRLRGNKVNVIRYGPSVKPVG